VARLIAQVLIALIVIGTILGIATIMLLFLGQDWTDALFWILSAVMIIAALLVVVMRDIIRCGLAMIVCFGSLAGIYVLMGAPLIGAAQVIVYIGAISVLILFAIMLTQTKDAPVILAVVLALAVTATDWHAAAERATAGANKVAALLFDQYVLPFEIVSVLLLAAVVGGVFLAKREPGGPS